MHDPFLNPTVSVVIPTYNRAHLIRVSLTSIFEQTYRATQIIVVDDGSADETRGEIESLLQAHPYWKDKLLYIWQKNGGKSTALNAALECVTSDWIAFNDSDDCWKPEKLALQLAALRRFPDCGACFTGAVHMTDGVETVSSFAESRIVLERRVGRLQNAVSIAARLGHGIMMQSILVRSDIMKAVGPFDPTMRVAQDVDFIFRLSLNTPLCYVRRPLVAMDRPRDRKVGLTTEFGMLSVKRLELREKMVAKWRNLIADQPPEIASLVERRLQDTLSALANRLAESGERAKATEALDRALAVRFSWRLFFKRSMIRFGFVGMLRWYVDASRSPIRLGLLRWPGLKEAIGTGQRALPHR